MVTSPAIARDLDRLAAATARLQATVASWEAADLAAPSILPGWSRAHVLTHLARNADGMRNLLLAARTGAPIAMYPSQELREADIAAGATRPAPLVLQDAAAAAERFAVDAAHLDEQAWARPVTVGPSIGPASGLILHRLREVEAHHVDLGAAYTFDESPRDALLAFFEVLPARLSGTSLDPVVLVATDLDREWRLGEGGDRISGRAAQLLSWLTGRSGPDGVTSARGVLPPAPGWG